MIQLFILNIINKFIENRIQLHSNGLFSYKDDVKRESSKINKIPMLTCFRIVEETLREVNYIKKDDKITRDHLYKIIVEMENLSSESIILLMAYLKNNDQSDNDIDKINNSLISKFHTNDIDFYLSILVNLLTIKSGNLTHLESTFINFNSILCFLTNTPYDIDTSVGINNDILVDDNINMIKRYKIKYKKNSLDLNATKKDKCFDSFYVDPDFNPNKFTNPANLFLKAGWERKALKQVEIKGLLKKMVNHIYQDLMFYVGKSKDTEEVYFKNEPMCQRRWTNTEIQNDDEIDAYYDEKEYIDQGEDVYNLYDPDVTDKTSPDSDLYKNNEILKKIWFYSDDIFPIQPNISPIFNVLDQRAEFSFKTLKIQNKDIFKISPFQKEDLHIIIPMLWLYKIHNEYTSTVSNVVIDNKIELLFNYFKPEDMLVYFKKHILLDNNTFDTETLSFLIILSALSKITSLLIDNRFIKKNIKDFEPENFNLFSRLSVFQIKELIQNHQNKRDNYVNYLNITIHRYIFSDEIKYKIQDEYETRNTQIRQYYIRNALNILQITGSNAFIRLFGYQNNIKTREYINQSHLLQLDKNIAELITPELISESVDRAETNQSIHLLRDGSSSIPVYNNSTSTPTLSIMNNQSVPLVVDLSIASNLVKLISGNKYTRGINVSNALKALNLIKFKISLLQNENSLLQPNISESSIQDSSLNSDPLVIELLKNFRNSTGTRVKVSNSEIVKLLFQSGELVHIYTTDIKNMNERMKYLEIDVKNWSENGWNVEKEISKIAQIKQEILQLESKYIQEKYDLQSKLTSIIEHVPLDPNIVGVKVLPSLHGSEANINKRMLIDCGKFKYIGLVGEPGRSTSFQISDEHYDKLYNGIPSAKSITNPLSEYCEIPIITFQLRDELIDNVYGGINVEIEYKNGSLERKTIATNQQLSKIFEKHRVDKVTNAFDLPSFLPILENILRLNGLDPSISCVAFDSCRGLGINFPLKNTAEYIFEELAINAGICRVSYNPQIEIEYIPDEIKRVNVLPEQYMGQVITKESRPFFDTNNPKQYAGHIVWLRFGDYIDMDYRLCIYDDPEVIIHYSLLMAFNNYLKSQPNLLITFNRLSSERRKQLFEDIILSSDYTPISSDPITNFTRIYMKYQDKDMESLEIKKQIDKELWIRNIDIEPYYQRIYDEHFNNRRDGKRFLDIHMGTPSRPYPDMNLLLRQHIQKLNREQFSEEHPYLGFLSGILAGGYPDKDIDLSKYFEEAKLFNFNTYITDIKNIYFDDLSILDSINKLEINNVFKTIKIQIEKIKIYIRITMKKKIDEDFFKFIYSYFYEVIYRYLLMILNSYKNELINLYDKLKTAGEYFDIFKKNCIKNDYFDFKRDKLKKSELEDKKKILVKDYNDALKTFDDTSIDRKLDTDIISILQNLQLSLPICKTILDKHADLIDDLIIQRWVSYIITYDISITSCNLKAEIEEIEFRLIMETSRHTNILQPLTFFIPKYNELIHEKYDFYIERTLTFIRENKYDSFIDDDFVNNYYNIILNKIQNIETNIFEIRKTNNDIYQYFNVNRIKNLNNPLASQAKYNIYVYSEQLSYYLNNSDKMFNILDDNISLDNDIQPIEVKPINENITLWLTENTPNTVENKLLLFREKFNNDYEKVQMNDLILKLIV